MQKTTPMRDKKKIILDAAISLFLEYGFSETTTDMIQRKAGVSKATMYAHYPNKENLFVAAVEHECAMLVASFDSLSVKSSEIRDSLTQLGAFYLDLVLAPTSLSLYRIVVAVAPKFPGIGMKFQLAGPQRIKDRIEAKLSEASQKGEIYIQDIGAERATGIFISMVRGEAHMECLLDTDNLPSEQQKKTWIKDAVETFLKAYGKP